MVDASQLVVLDRDGVINADSDDYIKTPAQWQPLPGSLEAIARLTAAGRVVVVVSNQSGIGRGLFDRAALASIHAKMVACVEAVGGRLAGIYYCPHAPGEHCACRKPQPGLLHRLQRDFGLPALAGVPFVGDKPADLAAARSVDARAILVRTGKGKATEASLPESPSTEIFDDLARVADALLAEAD